MQMRKREPQIERMEILAISATSFLYHFWSSLQSVLKLKPKCYTRPKTNKRRSRLRRS